MSKVIDLNAQVKNIDPADSFILEARKLYSVSTFGAEIRSDLIFQVGFNFLYGIVSDYWIDELSHLVPSKEAFLGLGEDEYLDLASLIIGVKFEHWLDFIVYHSELVASEASMIKLDGTSTKL